MVLLRGQSEVDDKSHKMLVGRHQVVPEMVRGEAYKALESVQLVELRVLGFEC